MDETQQPPIPAAPQPTPAPPKSKLAPVLLTAALIAGIALNIRHFRGGPLTREALNKRLAQAIEQTKDSEVVYEDILGEGDAHWDPHPRYPQGTVNCIIWITQV